MLNTNKKQRSAPEPTAYEFFTGGDSKTSDLTVYYNIAFDSIEKIRTQVAQWPSSKQNAFLAEYLWKAHYLRKNSNGYDLTPKDEWIIIELLKKVEAIRNFHSHIWHDNEVLAFDENLKDFVMQKYEEAKAALFTEFPNALMDYERLEKMPKSGCESRLFVRWVHH